MSSREAQESKSSVNKLIHSISIGTNPTTKSIIRSSTTTTSVRNRRSVSPSPSTSPLKTKVSLLQNRIINKLNRSHSDLSNEISRSSPRSQSAFSASRLIHSVRRSSSTNQLVSAASVPSQSSYSPARSIDCLYFSSDLVSPQVVKKAISMGNVIRHKSKTNSNQQNHKIRVKLEVTKPSSSGSSGGGGSIRKSKEILTLKSNTSADLNKRDATSETGSSSHKKSKKSNGKNNAAGAGTSSSTTGGGSSSTKFPKSVKISNTVSVQNGNNHTMPINQSNGNGNNLPVKPPRKTKSVVTKSNEKSSNKQSKSSNNANTTTIGSGLSPYRHAGCLIPVPPPQPTTSTTPPIRSSSSSRPTSPFQNAAVVVASAPIKTSQVKTLPTSRLINQSSTPTVSTASTAIQSTNTSRKSRQTLSSGGSSKGGSPSAGGLSKVSNRSGTSSSPTTTTTKSSSSSNKKSSSSAESKSQTANNNFQKAPNNMKVVVSSAADNNRTESRSTSPTIKKPFRKFEHDLNYMTIPLIRKYHLESIYSSSRSLNSYRSLPTLTPYLAETKRVTNSIFLTRAPWLSPSVRPTKTSLMREIICREPIAVSTTNLLKKEPGGTKRISDSLQTIQSYGRTADGSSVRSSSPMYKNLTTTGESHMSRSRRRRSLSCLNLRDYSQYILQLRHSYRNRSPRFTQLHRLYSSLDRLCQLERSTTSLYDIPVLSSSKRHDFDAWWKVRNRLRVDQEISLLSKQLLQAQSEREFFFRPKILENYRWHPDSGLRFKKWSVEELKNFMLHCEVPKPVGSSSLGNRPYTTTNLTSWDDLYKTHWRGMSVKELALNLEVAEFYKKQTQMHDADFYENRIPFLRRAFSMSSTLSEEQREGIKKRIGTLITTTTQQNNCLENGEGVRESRNRDRIVTSRMGFTYSSDSRRSMNNDVCIGSGGLTESAKKELSRSLSKEFKERKVKETNLLRDTFLNQKLSSSVTGVDGIIGSRTENWPISTKIALRKAESQMNNKVKAKTVPFYSVYCKDGVNNRIKVFEESKHPSSSATTEERPNKGINISNKLGRSREFLFRKSSPEGQRSEGAPPQSYNRRCESPLSLPPFRSISPRRSASPPIRKMRSVTPDRMSKEYVSHVNIISKLASLLLKRNTSLKNLVTREVLERDKLERLRSLNYGEVERLRDYFETNDEDFYGIKSPEINVLRCLFCSDSNLAKITERLDEDHKRRCASAMEIDSPTQSPDNNSTSKRLRAAPDGSSSSPTPPATTGNPLYLSTRSRKPIYQPSSTPNICQPTLTAHCYLSQSDSIEQIEVQQDPIYPSNNNTDNNYDSLGSYYNNSYSSPAPSSLSSYYPAVPLLRNPPNSSGQLTHQKRILDERLTSQNVNKNIGKNYSYTNYDPSVHQPKYRYVPKPPVLMDQQQQQQVYKYQQHSLSTPPQIYPDYYRCGSSLSSLPNTFVVDNNTGYGLPPPPLFFNKGRPSSSASTLGRSKSFHSTILGGRVNSPPGESAVKSSSFRNMGVIGPPPQWNWTRAVQQQQQNKQQQGLKDNNNEAGSDRANNLQNQKINQKPSSNFERIVKSANSSSIINSKTPSYLAGSLQKNVPQETSV